MSLHAGRIHVKQIAHKEVVTLVFAEVLAHGVVGTWNDDELKVLVGLDERIDHLHCRRRIDIVVEFAHDKHKRTAKQMRILDIGTLLILVAHG